MPFLNYSWPLEEGMESWEDQIKDNLEDYVYQLTFRLVVARPWLRNLLLGNVFVRNVWPTRLATHYVIC